MSDNSADGIPGREVTATATLVEPQKRKRGRPRKVPKNEETATAATAKPAKTQADSEPQAGAKVAVVSTAVSAASPVLAAVPVAAVQAAALPDPRPAVAARKWYQMRR